MLDSEMDDAELQASAVILTSYLLRRAVCNLNTKNYNRTFLTLTRNLRADGFTSTHLRSHLLALSGESNVWPDDATFKEAWLTKPIYENLNNPRLVYILGSLNQTFLGSKTEKVKFTEAPSVEHLLPRSWTANWPLPNGSKGMDFMEQQEAEPNGPRAVASRLRDAALETIGNLTIITMALNASQSNSAWPAKRQQLGLHSVLPINQDVIHTETWDEAAILKRGESLFQRALTIWPR